MRNRNAASTNPDTPPAVVVVVGNDNPLGLVVNRMNQG